MVGGRQVNVETRGGAAGLKENRGAVMTSMFRSLAKIGSGHLFENEEGTRTSVAGLAQDETPDKRESMGLAEGMLWSKQWRARSCSKHERRRPNSPRQQTGVKPNTCLTRLRQASQAGQADSTRPDRAKHGRTEQREACLSMSRASSDSTHVNRVNFHRIRADGSGCTP